MHARVLASHYLLLPGGKIGKWPLITVSAEGVILKVEMHSDGFKETAGVEFHSGMMIPGLIDACQVNERVMLNSSLLIDHHAAGTILLILPKGHPSWSSGEIKNLQLNIPPPHPALDRSGNNYLMPLFERIKRSVAADPGSQLSRLLYLASEWAGKATNTFERLGSLEEGKSPGIALIQGLDLTTFTPSAGTRIKWLVKAGLNL